MDHVWATLLATIEVRSKVAARPGNDSRPTRHGHYFLVLVAAACSRNASATAVRVDVNGHDLFEFGWSELAERLLVEVAEDARALFRMRSTGLPSYCAARTYDGFNIEQVQCFDMISCCFLRRAPAAPQRSAMRTVAITVHPLAAYCLANSKPSPGFDPVSSRCAGLAGAGACADANPAKHIAQHTIQMRVRFIGTSLSWLSKAMPWERRRNKRPLWVGSGPSNYTRRMTALGLRSQPIDATHWLNRSAGVSKLSVFLGRSFNRLATAFSFAWE